MRISWVLVQEIRCVFSFGKPSVAWLTCPLASFLGLSDPPSTSLSSTLVPHYHQRFSLCADALSGCLLFSRTLSWLSELTRAPDVSRASLKRCTLFCNGGGCSRENDWTFAGLFGFKCGQEKTCMRHQGVKIFLSMSACGVNSLALSKEFLVVSCLQ